MSYIFLFILVMTALTVLHRTRLVIGQYKCPEESVLQQYKAGVLKKRKPSAYENLIRHLGVCEQCQDALRDIDSPRIEDHLIEE